MEEIGKVQDIDNIRANFRREQRKLRLQKLKSNYGFTIGFIIIIILLLIGVLAPLITKHDPFAMKVTNRLLSPNKTHLFGTDEFGRDLMTRTFYGARVSMGVGFSVCLISSILGLVIGVYASYYKILDNIFMRICDGLIAIPGVLLAIALMSAFGASIWNVIIALTIVFTPSVARIVRSSALMIKEQAYIEAEHVQGSGDFRIIWLHIVPNVISPLMVQATFVFASAILSEAALSFLGVGIPEPQPSWGNILQASKLVINKAWWMAVVPGTMLVLTVLGLNLLGDGLRDLLDPRIINSKSK